MKRLTLPVLSLMILFSLVFTSCAAPTQPATVASTSTCGNCANRETSRKNGYYRNTC